MKLGTKLISSYLFVVILVAVVGIISRSLNQDVNQTLKDENRLVAESIQYASNMERNLYQAILLIQTLKDYDKVESNTTVLNRKGKGQIIEEIYAQFDELAENQKELKSLVLKSENKAAEDEIFLDGIEGKFLFYKGVSENVITSIERGDAVSAEEVYFLNLLPYFEDNIRSTISELKEFIVSNQERTIISLDEGSSQVDMVTIWTTIIAFLIALSIIILVNSSIVKPIYNLSEAAKSVGQGDLNYQLSAESSDEIGQLAQSFNLMVDNLKKRTISRDFLDNIIEGMHESLFIADDKGMIERANNAATKLSGYSHNELIGKSLDELGIKQVQASENNEVQFVHREGNKIDVSLSVNEVSNPAGDIIQKLYVAYDITERKKAEEHIKNSLEEKKVLLAEIHHRVKNNLAVISGLLQLQSWNIKSQEAKNVLYDSQLRVQSIALVHEMLYESDSLAYIRYDKYINDLLQAISSMYMDTGLDVKLDSDVEEIELTINQAIPCSLLLNEIIVNAYKHAFSDQKEGSIKVKMRQEMNKILIEVADNGKGMTAEDGEGKGSLGMTLIKTLIKQIDGEYEILPNDCGGTTVNVVFELDY